MDASVPRLADFTDAEKMAAEYAVMRIYPHGHLMQFVRPTLAPGVLSCADEERRDDGAPVLVAGHPVAPRLQAVQEGAWQQVVLIAGEISRWDGTSNTIVSGVRMPEAHN